MSSNVDLKNLTADIHIPESTSAVPSEHLFHVFEGVLGTELWFVATGPPDPQRFDAVADDAPDP